MQYTGNYKLKKPDGTDLVKISDLNDNADIIDQKLRELDNHTNDKNNPHGTTPEQIGAETPEGVQAKVDVVQQNLLLHINDKNNPHMVTPSQIGAETPTGAQNRVDAHAKRTDNPHKVTRTQLGLANVVTIDDTDEPSLTLTLKDFDKKLMPAEATKEKPAQITLPPGVRFIQFHWSGVLSANYGATARVGIAINDSVVISNSYTGDNPGGWTTSFDEITERIPITSGTYTISVVCTDSDNSSALATVHSITKVGLNVGILWG